MKMVINQTILWLSKHNRIKANEEQTYSFLRWFLETFFACLFSWEFSLEFFSLTCFPIDSLEEPSPMHVFQETSLGKYLPCMFSKLFLSGTTSLAYHVMICQGTTTSNFWELLLQIALFRKITLSLHWCITSPN